MIIIVIGILLSLYLWIRIDTTRRNRKIEEQRNEFWAKEHSANTIRKKDISSLDYITIPIDDLPFEDTTDETKQALQHSIMNLSKASILNFTGISNTDLKLQYGVANINFLSECDSNYTLLISTLFKWGSYLYEQGDYTNARTILEYGIQIKTDIRMHYIILGNIYKEQNTPNKIDDLIDVASTLTTLTKDTIVSSLREIKNSSYLV